MLDSYRGKMVLHKGKWYGYIVFDSDMLNWMGVETVEQLRRESEKFKPLMEEDVLITSVMIEEQLPVVYDRMKRLKVLFRKGEMTKQLVIEGVRSNVDKNDVLSLLSGLFGSDVDIISMVFKG